MPRITGTELPKPMIIMRLEVVSNFTMETDRKSMEICWELNLKCPWQAQVLKTWWYFESHGAIVSYTWLTETGH